jgi:chromosome segregation ATPase
MMEGQVITILLLAEALLLMAGATAFLWRRYRRTAQEAGRLKALMAEMQHQLPDYHGYLEANLRQARERYKMEVGREMTAWQLDEFEISQRPSAHALRLRHAFLTAEGKALSAFQREPRRLWPEKRAQAEWLVRCFERADKAIDHWLVRYQEVCDRVERLAAEVRGLQAKLAEADDRLADVLAYKKRFGALHEHVLEATDGSRALREDLHNRTEPVGPDDVAALLAEYERRSEPLEAYLERADVAPFDDRAAVQAQMRAAERRNSRSQALADTAAGRVTQTVEEIRAVAGTQRSLIGDLEAGLQAPQENQLISAYEQQIRQLKRTVGDADRCIEVLEAENERQRRTVQRLLKRLGAGEDREQQVKALEESVDRFARQAMELTARLYALQEEKEALERGNQSLRRPTSVPSP